MKKSEKKELKMKERKLAQEAKVGAKNTERVQKFIPPKSREELVEKKGEGQSEVNLKQVKAIAKKIKVWSFFWVYFFRKRDWVTD